MRSTELRLISVCALSLTTHKAASLKVMAYDKAKPAIDGEMLLSNKRNIAVVKLIMAAATSMRSDNQRLVSHSIKKPALFSSINSNTWLWNRFVAAYALMLTTPFKHSKKVEKIGDLVKLSIRFTSRDVCR